MTTPEEVQPEAPPLATPVMMNQDWRDLTFLHWAVPPEAVEPLMPPGVRADVVDGRTFVGLIPFRMVEAGVGRKGAVPWLGTFLETNVRLYSVDRTGRRGIVFCSLDADRAPVVVGARAVFGLSYRWAHMHHVRSRGREGDVHTYETRSRLAGRHRSLVSVRVGARREPTELDHFLTARWGLHVSHLRRGWYVPNVHERWVLHDAEVLHLDDDLVRRAGLGGLADRAPDHVAFSPGVHTEFGLPGSSGVPRRG